MTEVLIALVPIAVAVVPILRWPTLERRLRTHLALLKDVPPGVDAHALRALAEQELQQIAERDASRVTSTARSAQRQLLARTILFVIGLITLAPLILIPGVLEWVSELTPDWRYIVIVYGVALVMAFQWVASGWFLRRGQGIARRVPSRGQ